MLPKVQHPMFLALDPMVVVTTALVAPLLLNMVDLLAAMEVPHRPTMEVLPEDQATRHTENGIYLNH